MKTQKVKYLVLTLDRGKGNWSFALPAGLFTTTHPRERLRLCVRKAVFRNDFLVIRPTANTLYVDGAAVVLRSGSPSALRLVTELNASISTLSFAFDSYDGKLTVTNLSAAPRTLDPGTLANALGMTGAKTLAVGETYRMPYGVDLSPPETLFLRVDTLNSSSLEVNSSSAKSRDLLCAIGVDTPPYGTCIYRDPTSAYGQLLSVRQLNSLSLRLVDVNDAEQVSNNPITLIVAIEYVRDDEAEILRVLESQHELQSLTALRDNLEA